MNENNNYNDGRIPYKATVNLNTAIGNPSANINDTMDVNIKTMSTPTEKPVQSNDFATSTILTTPNIQNMQTESKTSESSNTTAQYNINNSYHHNETNTNLSNQNIQDTTLVKKTYVNMDNQTKKKTVKFNIGPEFKIAFLIVVILLVFVFLLPIINNIIFGY